MLWNVGLRSRRQNDAGFIEAGQTQNSLRGHVSGVSFRFYDEMHIKIYLTFVIQIWLD